MGSATPDSGGGEGLELGALLWAGGTVKYQQTLLDMDKNGQ